jgi:hypothetical protein
MPRRLTVLITNIAFAFRSGSEIVVELIARGLFRRGHRPIVFAPWLGGSLPDELRRSGIAVVDRLNQVGFAPDIIHGQHNVTTVMALAAFPQTPALFYCHDLFAAKDRAPLLPRIRRYIAVDESCQERMIRDGVPRTKIEVVYNAVDLNQYRRRGALPPRPHRVLVLTKGAEHLSVVRAMAATAGLALDELGPGTGRVVDDLSERLPAYDLVVTTARMAKEAIAVGCAVIVCDHRGFAGLATTSVLADWRRHNFGQRLLTHPVTEENLLQALAAYDARDASIVTDLIRAEDNVESQIDQFERIYSEILDDGGPIDSAQDLEALAPFLEDFLISRDFSRPWTDLYRNVTAEAADFFELALRRHTTKMQTDIMEGLKNLARQMDFGSIDLAAGRTARNAKTDFHEYLSFTTPRERWNYAVVIPCPRMTMPSIVEIETKIECGMVGFGLNDAGLTQYMTEELTVSAADGRTRVRLIVKEPKPGMVLVVRNVAESGERSRGTIFRAQILVASSE